jgi:hypothetical protein
VSSGPKLISPLGSHDRSGVRQYWTLNVVSTLLLIASLASLYINGLGIHYASDDDVVISWWFHHDLFHSAAISAKSLGRFFFVYFAPVSSTFLQIKNDYLFNVIRLAPYVAGMLGFATFMNTVDRSRFPLLLTFAVCLAFTPIWAGYTPLLGYPWWYSLGFAAFTSGSLTWLQWFERRRWYSAISTFFLIGIALCTVEAFIPMLLVPAIVIGSRVSTSLGKTTFAAWTKRVIVSASPVLVAVFAYLTVYVFYRLQNPSSYEGNRLSFAVPQLFITWIQATITPLPGWDFFRTNSFSFDLAALGKKVFAFVAMQPFYGIKALFVGLSVFAFYRSRREVNGSNIRQLTLLAAICVIGAITPNFLMSLTPKHQQMADLAYQPYFYSFYSLPFCLAGGLLLFGAGANQFKPPVRIFFGALGATAATFLSLATDVVNSASAHVLRENNLKWRAVDQFISSGCLGVLPDKAVIYAPSLGWGADYWARYFLIRVGRKFVVTQDCPPNVYVAGGPSRFVFTYIPSQTNDGYFWEFGSLNADPAGNRLIKIGVCCSRKDYLLSGFVSGDENFWVKMNGKTFSGKNHRFGPVLMTKSERAVVSMLSLNVQSQSFPVFSTSEDLPDKSEIVKPAGLPGN